jgi:vancomycin resistance protein VanW
VPRTPLSKRFPALKPLIEELKILERTHQTSGAIYRLRHDAETLERVTVFSRHKSLLRRKLGETDLIDGKIHNLRVAVPKFAYLRLEPGQVLSFWKLLGRASAANGFTSGMLIQDGTVTQGIGGGLCQLANLLYWMALHSPLEVLEHHHHSLDIFPDSGRVLPFGSGASVYYNYVDVRLRNATPHPLGLHVWLSDSHLHGILWTNAAHPHSYKIVERDHAFYRRSDGTIYRRNTLHQVVHDRRTGQLVGERIVTRNDSRVLYQPSTGIEVLPAPGDRAATVNPSRQGRRI